MSIQANPYKSSGSNWRFRSLVQAAVFLLLSGLSPYTVAKGASAEKTDSGNSTEFVKAKRAFDKGDYKTSLKLAETQVERNPKDWNWLELLYLTRHKQDQAGTMQKIRSQIGSAAADAQTWCLYGMLLNREEKGSQARAALEKAITLAPHDPHALYLCGYNEDCLGNNSAAIKFYERSIEAQPTYRAYQLLATSQKRFHPLNGFDNACQAVKLRPDTGFGWSTALSRRYRPFCSCSMALDGQMLCPPESTGQGRNMSEKVYKAGS